MYSVVPVHGYPSLSVVFFNRYRIMIKYDEIRMGTLHSVYFSGVSTLYQYLIRTGSRAKKPAEMKQQNLGIRNTVLPLYNWVVMMYTQI